MPHLAIIAPPESSLEIVEGCSGQHSDPRDSEPCLRFLASGAPATYCQGLMGERYSGGSRVEGHGYHLGRERRPFHFPAG